MRERGRVKVIEVVDLPGSRTASYQVVGRGLPTLMFPGGPGFAADYMRPDAELLAHRLRSFLIDPHGSGQSTPPKDSSECTPEGHARFYEEVRTALGLQEVTVLGHSFGAITGLVYCALFPDAVTRFVCVAGSALSAETSDPESETAREQWEAALSRHRQAHWYEQARSTLDSWTERVLATDDPTELEEMMVTVLPLYTSHPDNPKVAEALRSMRKYLTADLAAAKAWESGTYQSLDLRPLLPRVQCPTLIVAGEDDFICGPSHARVIADAIADSRTVLIPNCGHLPSCEAPDVYRQAVDDFLSS
jgi:proline iminopeptidase